MSSLGLGRKEVRLSEHDPAWRDAFAREAARLNGALGRHALGLEHIGSTAVLGLIAKPLLDIMVGIDSLSQRDAIVPLLEEIGYEFRPHDDLPDRLFFILNAGDARIVNLSLAEITSAYWRDHLRFRDILRAEPETARAYAELKLALAAEFAADRLAYTAAKGDFILAALSRTSIADSR